MTEETRCSLAASDKGSSGMAVRTFQLRGKYRSEQQNILRTEERRLLNVWTDFNRNSE